MLLRFRTSFGGRINAAGQLERYTLEQIKGARDLSLLAEQYLYHPALLPILANNEHHRLIVADYLAQSIEADMGKTDSLRFLWTVRGVIEFLKLGLHRNTAGAADEKSLGDEALFLTGFENASPAQIAACMNAGISCNLFDTNPVAFENALHFLEDFYRSGQHRGAA